MPDSTSRSHGAQIRGSRMSEPMFKEHLREALDESDPVEKNYHIRSALQYVVSQEASEATLSHD